MSLTILDNKPIKQRIRRSCSICNTDNRITIVNKDGIHKCVHCWKKTNKYEELAVYCNNCSNLSPQNLTKYCKKCNLSVGYCCMAVCIETNDQYICRHCFKYKCIKCNKCLLSQYKKYIRKIIETDIGNIIDKGDEICRHCIDDDTNK